MDKLDRKALPLALQFILGMADFTTPEEEYSAETEEGAELRAQYEDAEDYECDLGGDRTFDEYQMFMREVRDAKKIVASDDFSRIIRALEHLDKWEKALLQIDGGAYQGYAVIYDGGNEDDPREYYEAFSSPAEAERMFRQAYPLDRDDLNIRNARLVGILGPIDVFAGRQSTRDKAPAPGPGTYDVTFNEVVDVTYRVEAEDVEDAKCIAKEHGVIVDYQVPESEIVSSEPVYSDRECQAAAVAAGWAKAGPATAPSTGFRFERDTHVCFADDWRELCEAEGLLKHS